MSRKPRRKSWRSCRFCDEGIEQRDRICPTCGVVIPKDAPSEFPRVSGQPSEDEQDARPAFLPDTDLKDIKGQTPAKRALEVAAAGGHNVLMIGPPSMIQLARALLTILPRLEPGEIVELTERYSAMGLLGSSSDVVLHRPLIRAVYSVPKTDFVGELANPGPGQIILAHLGVLLIDELPLFGPRLLNTLRQSLEDGRIHVARVEGAVTFPNEFILVAAMCPCPCGFNGWLPRCKCTPAQIGDWRARISGPVLDRIDLKIQLNPPTAEERFTPGAGESSHEIRARVEDARRMQKERFKGTTIKLNARIPGGQGGQYCELQVSARRALEEVNGRVPELTTRGFDQLLKVSRTVADLNNSALIKKKHVAEAAELCGDEAVKGFFLTHVDVEQS